MNKDNLAELHRLIDEWASKQPSISFTAPEEPARQLPEGKRVVRTKSTGDRVYFVDETAKTKAWVTSPEILEKLGFTMADVQDIEDSEMLGYRIAASVYRVED